MWRLRFGAASLGFDFWSNRTQDRQLATACNRCSIFLSSRSCVVQALKRGVGPRYTLRRSTASIAKIWLFFRCSSIYWNAKQYRIGKNAFKFVLFFLYFVWLLTVTQKNFRFGYEHFSMGNCFDLFHLDHQKLARQDSFPCTWNFHKTSSTYCWISEINFSLHSRYYAKACNEWRDAGITVILRLGNIL